MAPVKPAFASDPIGVVATDGMGGGEIEGDPSAANLKRKTTHGALVSVVGQTVSFVLRTGSMIILARLLTPKDFGLVGMVAAFTGFLGLFRDCGLSMATVQRAAITDAQTSTLFWINLAVGGLLAALAGVAAPGLAAFYDEPRVLWITVALGTSFVFNGAAAQHRAMLQRSMRFLALAIIDIVSLVLSTGAGIGIALAGQGYWALVVMTVTLPAVGVVGAWIATAWVPGRPQRRSGIRSMLWFGGAVTLNNIVSYVGLQCRQSVAWTFLGGGGAGCLWAGLSAHQFADREPEFDDRVGGIPSSITSSERSRAL
jgi:O-antigen/teichoic acid export membrane protein